MEQNAGFEAQTWSIASRVRESVTKPRISDICFSDFHCIKILQAYELIIDIHFHFQFEIYLFISLEMIGMAKAKVLPEPVNALPTRSLQNFLSIKFISNYCY